MNAVKNQSRLTFISSSVYHVLLGLCCFFLELRFLVEHGCFLRISIILTCDTMSPSMTYKAISFSEKFRFLLERPISLKSFLYFCNFCSCFTRHPQCFRMGVWSRFQVNLWRIIFIQSRLYFSKKLQILFFGLFIITSFRFINRWHLGSFFVCWDVRTFL